MGDRSGYLYAYHLADGSPAPGWPVFDGGAPIDSTPSVAALEGATLGSVFVGAGNAQHPGLGGYLAYGPNGQSLWQTAVTDPATDKHPAAGVQASLTVADLQGGTDVFAGSLDQESYALERVERLRTSGLAVLRRRQRLFHGRCWRFCMAPGSKSWSWAGPPVPVPPLASATPRVATSAS